MIRFNQPLHLGTEPNFVQRVFEQGLQSDFRARCESWFQARAASCAALMTTSCTHALELAALVAGIGPGDEVILPGYTFVSSANAFALRGAVPVFVDIRPDTCNIDEQAIEAAITERTRAVVVVHYGGVACEMEAILSVARRHGLLVIEDAAHGVMAEWRGQPLGSIGDLGALSFHATKNYTSGGEGGMLLVNDPALTERARLGRAKGTDRDAFLRGEVDRYTWQAVGSNYLPSEVQAACLFAQLSQAEQVNERRRVLWQRYAEALGPLAAAYGFRVQSVPAGCQHNAHLFYLRLPAELDRDSWVAALAKQGIEACSHYTPLHTAPAGLLNSRFHGSDRETLAACNDLVRLPLHYALTDAGQARVIDAVAELMRRC